MKLSKIFTLLVLVPQMIATVTALYETVKRIDDDPALREVFAQVKTTVAGAETLKTIRVQVAVLKSQFKQLTA